MVRDINRPSVTQGERNQSSPSTAVPRPATAGGADRARHPINGATLAMPPRHAIGVAARARVSSRMHAGAGWVRPSRSSGRYNDRSLWVSYADVYTIRRRVLGVAQRVREQLMLPTERSPELILPRDERLRHGFWFMRFGNVEDALAVQKSLDGQRFQSECGSLEGLLQMPLCKARKCRSEVKQDEGILLVA